MIVSNKHRFVFFHNPKAAGTSFRRAIEQYHDFGRVFWGEEYSPYFNATVDLAHLRAWELPCVAPNLFSELNRYRTLVFVRNPARRFISACFEHFHKFKPDIPFDHADVETQQALIRNLIANDIDAKKILADFRYVHFSQQTWFIFLGSRRIAEHILPVREDTDNFRAAFDALSLPYKPAPHENRRASDRFGQLMCQEIDAFVRRFYRRDYEFLAGQDHLAPLACDQPS